LLIFDNSSAVKLWFITASESANAARRHSEFPLKFTVVCGY